MPDPGQGGQDLPGARLAQSARPDEVGTSGEGRADVLCASMGGSSPFCEDTTFGVSGLSAFQFSAFFHCVCTVQSARVMRSSFRASY